MEMSLYNLYKELKLQNMIFCYSGPIAQSSIEGVGCTLRKNLEAEEIDNAATLSVFSIFVEQVQNILNYSAEKLGGSGDSDDELRVGTIVIGREDNGDFYIYCGNRIKKADISNLARRLEEIKFLSRDELKSLYKERRRMESGSGSKGGGLGLIEMARKSGKPLEYSFVDIDEQFSFFSIKVVVGRK